MVEISAAKVVDVAECSRSRCSPRSSAGSHGVCGRSPDDGWTETQGQINNQRRAAILSSGCCPPKQTKNISRRFHLFTAFAILLVQCFRWFLSPFVEKYSSRPCFFFSPKNSVIFAHIWAPVRFAFKSDSPSPDASSTPTSATYSFDGWLHARSLSNL